MFKVVLEKSQYGVPQPTVYITEGPRHHRKLAAETYRLAAAVEDATPPRQDWGVVPDRHNGTVHLELMTGNEAEVQAGLDLLNSIANNPQTT